MSKLKCIDCGTVFDDSQHACPTCGCPKEACEKIPEPKPEPKPKPQQEAHASPKPADNNAGNAAASVTDEQDFNESHRYSPFSQDSWFKREPWPLRNYPRRVLAERHRFWGWLLDPWHLTCRNEENKEAYDTINNIFYLCNLIFKVNLYACLFAFFKMIWLFMLLIVIVLLGTCYPGEIYEYLGYYGVYVFTVILIPVCFIILYIVAAIALCCGLCNALHRYWSSFFMTWRRLNKRYWNEMKH